MVQAILEGRKTMTRRTKGLDCINPRVTIFEKSTGWLNQGNWIGKKQIAKNPDAFEVLNIIKCPYNVGDILWVRETWQIRDLRKPNEIFYKASDDMTCAPWKPSIFMPKSACRIFLKVKSIRVERLQDVSEEDAKAEGAKDILKINELKMLKGLGDWQIPRPFLMHQFGFLSIWCKINGCENWLQNPFVFVYEFEQIEKPSDFI